ncbi:uncharacterized protein [Rutidosis leptorrhynchoides]|uniref:uncharacterized protein n=1 Tax=Rutidosis leptorrhynchoides TaxID=125765 RepID=UPI003A98E970
MSDTEDLLHGDYFEAKITCRNKIKRIKFIRSRLSTQQRKLFDNTCFRYWLDIKFQHTDPGYIHFLLQNQISRPAECKLKEEPEELWFKVTSDYNIRCGRREFCLVTSMRFGPNANFKHYIDGDKGKTKPRFASRVLKNHPNNRFKVEHFLNLIKDKDFFSGNDKRSDEDCVRVVIVLLVQECFLGKMPRDRIDINFLHLLDDLNLMNQFP